MGNCKSYQCKQMHVDKDTRIAALEAKLAERVKVKPLEWTPAANDAGKDGLWFVAIDVFGKKHEVIRSYHGQNGAGWTYGDTWYGNIDEAKAAAQADYERRILSTLTTEPAADDAALRTLLESNAALERERDQLRDKLHCMCGSPIDHSAWEGHTPVSVYDYSLDQERSRAEAAEAQLAEAKRFIEMALDYEGDVFGRHHNDVVDLLLPAAPVTAGGGDA